MATVKRSVKAVKRQPKILDKQVGYDAANNRGKGRDAVPAERKNEDGILPNNKRVNLIASQRDSYRNSTFSPATAQQLQVNVVGTEGGRLSLTTADADFNDSAAKAFRRWARHCEFTNGTSLNELLQLLLISLTHQGGDFIAVFDDGIICNSGKVKIFEADEIKPLEDGAWQKLLKTEEYAGCTQSNGIVYDRFGRIYGAFVSSSARGNDVFTADQCLQLRLRVPGEFDGSNWIFVGQRWRVNQGRGVATSTHVTNTLRDLADTQASEVQAGKLNSSLGLIVKDTAATAGSGLGDAAASAFGGDGTGGAMTAEEDAEYQRAIAGAGQTMREGGSAVVRVAPGTEVSSFNTSRPSNATVEFIKKLEGACATVYGMGATYVTLDPQTSYSAFRGAMVLARLSFEKLQKKLEREFLDWLAVRYFAWAMIGDEDTVGGSLFWSWPGMREIDESSYQSALEKKFTNFETTLQQRHGADWKRIINELEVEVKYCEEHGVLHPCYRTVSGGQVDPNVNVEETEEAAR